MVKLRWSTLILLFGGALCAQAIQTDTLHYPELGLVTVSNYRLVPVEELSRAEQFQRGIVPGATDQLIRMVDSVEVRDTAGQIIPHVTFLALHQSQIDSLNAARRQERKPAQERARYLSTNIYASQGRTIYYGRVGEELRDTLTVNNFDRAPVTTYLHVPLLGFGIADSVSLSGQASRALPFTYRFTAATERTTVRGSYTGKDTAFVLPLTFGGYHLDLSDFQDRVPPQPAVHLRSRPTLRLYLPGPEKLLTVLRDGVVMDRIPVGRVIDSLDVSTWVPGDYTLRLSDLGTGAHTFAVVGVKTE